MPATLRAAPVVAASRKPTNKVELAKAAAAALGAGSLAAATELLGKLADAPAPRPRARTKAKYISVSLDQAAINALTRAESKTGFTTSDTLRIALRSLDRGKDPNEILAAVARVLGLDPATVTVESIQAALEGLDAQEQNPDPLADAPDEQPDALASL